MASPTPTRARALDFVRRGFTREETARKVKVSKRTVYRWVREAERAELATHAKPTHEPEAPPAPAPRPSAAAGARAEEITRHSVDSALAMAERALADGNTTAAAKLIRDALQGSNTLARIESKQLENQDVVAIPRVELDRAKARQADMLQRLRDDFDRCGFACATCARSIRIYAASDGAQGHPPVPVDAGSISPAQGIAILQALAGLVRRDRTPHS
jgi:hypothetical protein